MQTALNSILRRFIVVGRLTVRWPDGRVTTYAGPPGSGPDAAITLRDAATVRRLIPIPPLAVGEAYMDGGLIPDERGIYHTLDVLVMNLMANATGHADRPVALGARPTDSAASTSTTRRTARGATSRTTTT